MKMPKFIGWVVEKQYYKVTIEADSWLDAKDELCGFNSNWAKPDGCDTEIYDLEEVQNA
jgi:hypothetical protein